MTPIDLVRLTPLMDRTSGSPDVTIGLIDGPVLISHQELENQRIREIPGRGRGMCAQAGSTACVHGTFIAGILSARRGSVAPAICSNCTLLVRPIFAEAPAANDGMPRATPQELAQAILDCLDAGARVLNISAALVQPFIKKAPALEAALDEAARQQVLVIAAAGNQGTVGGTAITRHPWVTPVVGYNLQSQPLSNSNLGNSIGQRGLGAPGERITSLGALGPPLTLGGTSAAAPFVSGAVALLWSEFPTASATDVKVAVTQARTVGRTTVVPPLLNAWAAYQTFKK